jgi:hypothetical protein
MKIHFDHEKLDVYREPIAFCSWMGEFLSAEELAYLIKHD